jgi:hypothetical protein
MADGTDSSFTRNGEQFLSLVPGQHLGNPGFRMR